MVDNTQRIPRPWNAWDVWVNRWVLEAAAYRSLRVKLAFLRSAEGRGGGLWL